MGSRKGHTKRGENVIFDKNVGTYVLLFFIASGVLPSFQTNPLQKILHTGPIDFYCTSRPRPITLIFYNSLNILNKFIFPSTLPKAG